MKFCSHCGAPVNLRIPPGDNLPRFVCDRCHTVHYQNPKLVVGCIPEWDDRVLLCRRAIEPRYGLWTLPAGFMENGETTLEAAARETLEEAKAAVEIGALFSLYNLPHINQVYLIFRSRLLALEHQPGAESLETALFEEGEIPWEELAFPVVRFTLEHYFADRRSGRFDLHIGELRRPPDPR
jgi:ADP-ribose pyrophosphatase YjhB (NUDIX family)